MVKTTVRSTLRLAQWVFGGAGVLLLTYCAVVLASGWFYQHGERRRLDQLLHDRQQASDARRQALSTAPSAPAVADGLFGRIEIPRLDLSIMVVEGVDTLTLRGAAGHIPSTALPGKPGNIGIAAHRDTFFRPLRNIRRNDVITLTTVLGEYRYRVVSTKIVSPSDVSVLDPSEDEVLTLVTCYPFYYVGSAPQRFIVRAERVT